MARMSNVVSKALTGQELTEADLVAGEASTSRAVFPCSEQHESEHEANTSEANCEESMAVTEEKKEERSKHVPNKQEKPCLYYEGSKKVASVT